MQFYDQLISSVLQVSRSHFLVIAASGSAILLRLLDRSPDKWEMFKEGLVNVSSYLIGRWVVKSAFRNLSGHGTVLDFFVEGHIRLTHFNHSGIKFALCILIVDFLYYWRHRLEHTLPFFWAVHSVHHTARYINWTASFRNSWFIRVISMWIFFPLLWFGFDVETIYAAYLIKRNYQFLIHTEYFNNLGPFEYIFNTPSLHRMHHRFGSDQKTHNYSAIFIWWDMLFGTYRKEDRSIPYSADSMPVGNNIWKVNFHHFGLLWERAKQTRTASPIGAPVFRFVTCLLFPASMKPSAPSVSSLVYAPQPAPPLPSPYPERP